MVRAILRHHADSAPPNWKFGSKGGRTVWRQAGQNRYAPDQLGAAAALIEMRATYVRHQHNITTTTGGLRPELSERGSPRFAQPPLFCALGRGSDIPAAVCFPRRRSRLLLAPEMRSQLAPDFEPGQTNVCPQSIVQASQLADALVAQAPSAKRPECRPQYEEPAFAHPPTPSGPEATLCIQDTDTAIVYGRVHRDSLHWVGASPSMIVPRCSA
jgi:hypothetical protein